MLHTKNFIWGHMVDGVGCEGHLGCARTTRPSAWIGKPCLWKIGRAKRTPCFGSRCIKIYMAFEIGVLKYSKSFPADLRITQVTPDGSLASTSTILQVSKQPINLVSLWRSKQESSMWKLTESSSQNPSSRLIIGSCRQGFAQKHWFVMKARASLQSQQTLFIHETNYGPWHCM